ATTHVTAIRNALANLVVDSLDVGGAGFLIFETAASAEVATLRFASTAFGAASAGVATAAAIVRDSSATGGIIAKFRMTDGAGADAGWKGSVTATGGGGDITMPNVTVAAGEPVEVSSLTYTASV
ncbi:hypothetical protein RXR00_29090, partial [Pseudomonas aeruginosa]|nr:hypothetical protein [Pseudomonas aeruginosa]